MSKQPAICLRRTLVVLAAVAVVHAIDLPIYHAIPEYHAFWSGLAFYVILVGEPMVAGAAVYVQLHRTDRAALLFGCATMLLTFTGIPLLPTWWGGIIACVPLWFVIFLVAHRLSHHRPARTASASAGPVAQHQGDALGARLAICTRRTMVVLVAVAAVALADILVMVAMHDDTAVWQGLLGWTGALSIGATAAAATYLQLRGSHRAAPTYASVALLSTLVLGTFLGAWWLSTPVLVLVWFAMFLVAERVPPARIRNS